MDTRQAARAVADARDHVEFLRALVADLEIKATAAKAAQQRAWGEAHRPLHDEGRKIRLDAARMADKAGAMLADAERLHQDGTDLIHQASSKGLPFPEWFDASWLYRSVSTEAAEHALWRDA
jgi:hypothetical protein